MADEPGRRETKVRAYVGLVAIDALFVLAASVSAGTFVVLTAIVGVPPIAAAAAAALAFGLVANFLLAGVFGVLSDAPLLTVYRERFLIQGLNSAAIGIAGGLSIVALW